MFKLSYFYIFLLFPGTAGIFWCLVIVTFSLLVAYQYLQKKMSINMEDYSRDVVDLK